MLDIDSFQSLYERLRDEMKAKWGRTMPLDELLFDRWELARYLGFEEGASIYHNSYVFGDVRVGAGTWIGPNVLLDGSGGTISIGSTCSISTGVHVYSHDTVAWALTGGRASKREAPVTIGNACYIGPMAVITKGITIGEHSLVGAMSVVTESVSPYSIIRGNPAVLAGRVHFDGDDLRLEFFDK